MDEKTTMTREEAITVLQDKHDECKAFHDLAAHPKEAYPGAKEYMEALQMALAALRGPTREQVEKEWRTHWVSVDSGRVSRCAHCGFEALYPEIYTFCPDCGRPFTDYAVDILLKRFEVLKDGKKAD